MAEREKLKTISGRVTNSIISKLIEYASKLAQPKQSAKAIMGYQLFLNKLGPDPDVVIEFLIEDFFVAGYIEEPNDLPELPCELLELPAGSDTFSIIHMKADELERLGAIVTVKEINGDYERT